MSARAGLKRSRFNRFAWRACVMTMEETTMTEATKTARLEIDGKTFELPVHSPTAGPDVIDIRKLYAQAGVFTYDPGYTSTASCESKITYIDGNEGVLLHGNVIYLIRGKVTEEFGVYSLAILCLEKLAYVRDERFG